MLASSAGMLKLCWEKIKLMTVSSVLANKVMMVVGAADLFLWNLIDVIL